MITILMATYNGELYLKEQLDSILGQSFQDFTLYVQDDCSTDGTWDILKEYEKAHPQKIKIRQNAKNTGDASINFFSMMQEHNECDYVMLSDQDDVWLSDKIEKSYFHIKKMEEKYGQDTPLLVHTDLKVVDKELRVLNESFFKRVQICYDRIRLNELLAQNVVTGCTVLYNMALARLFVSQPLVFFHDHWLALTASAFGEIDVLMLPLILYRQHGYNQVGAPDNRKMNYILKKLTSKGKIKSELRFSYNQAACLYEAFQGRLPPEKAKLIKEYSQLPKRNKMHRWYVLLKNGILKHGIKRKLAQLIFA